MKRERSSDKVNLLVTELTQLWMNSNDQQQIKQVVQALDDIYQLNLKIVNEHGVEDIIKQMVGRLARAYPVLAAVQNKRILDIACGSNSSKLPTSLYVNTPFGEITLRKAGHQFTALFEPWFCRMLLELGAVPVGVDFGSLEGERFIHHNVDLGQPGALDFLPEHSFDGIQDSRLFGSPEFTTEFPNPADRLAVAREIVHQEQRLLSTHGIIIHSDAMGMLGVDHE
jgi:hypothetical protein